MDIDFNIIYAITQYNRPLVTHNAYMSDDLKQEAALHAWKRYQRNGFNSIQHAKKATTRVTKSAMRRLIDKESRHKHVELPDPNTLTKSNNLTTILDPETLTPNEQLVIDGILANKKPPAIAQDLGWSYAKVLKVIEGLRCKYASIYS